MANNYFEAGKRKDIPAMLERMADGADAAGLSMKAQELRDAAKRIRDLPDEDGTETTN